MTTKFEEAFPSSTSHGPTVDWLRDISVVTVGRTRSLDVAARVLRQLGARIVPSSADGATEADIVLVDRISAPVGIAGRTDTRAAAYSQHVASINTSVWVTASAYGLTTSRGDAYASDLSLLAAGGVLAHSRIEDKSAPPTVTPGNLALNLVGYVMAVAALHGIHQQRSTGAPVHVDVSAQGAVIATGLALESAHALSRCPDEGGSARYGAPSGFFDCLDGSIYVLVLEQHQWQGFRQALAPALDTVETLAEARYRSTFVNDALQKWASVRTAEECERTLQAAGVPGTEVNSLQTFIDRARSAGRPVDITGTDAPPLPAQLTSTAADIAPAPGNAAKPLSSLRVLDAGHVLAVPLAAAWLGAIGAEVTKLEDPDRLDVYRRRGPFLEGKPGLNRSAYFNQLNFSKKTLDIAVGQGEVVDVSDFDVILQNLTPRRAKVVGVDADTVLVDGAPRLSVSSSGFGGNGEWSSYRAYGHNIHAFSGLVAATRDAHGDMGDMGTPWADPLTSVGITAWVLAWSLSSDRSTGVAVDISMAELTAVQIAELAGHDPNAAYAAPEIGGDFFIRPSSSAQLLAVTLRDANEVSRFEEVMARTMPKIMRKGELLDLGDLKREELSKVLLEAGFLVSPVLSAADLAKDEFVRSTGLFQTVESTALGQYQITGLPWHFVGYERGALTAAPERPESSNA